MTADSPSLTFVRNTSKRGTSKGKPTMAVNCTWARRSSAPPAAGKRSTSKPRRLSTGAIFANIGVSTATTRTFWGASMAVGL